MVVAKNHERPEAGAICKRRESKLFSAGMLEKSWRVKAQFPQFIEASVT
jgi:hypothetical protein